MIKNQSLHPGTHGNREQTKRIVAEITRNWTGAPSDLERPLLSNTFEGVILFNMERGYDLESWQFQSTEAGGLVETIVAVFVKVR